ncbi:leucine-rich repeat and immunoglobulin-like domain-containing nogo receptor-interacting protein 1 isoform X2 [Haliotis rufescens]|uniref:leucine-rich repeat and immunoglobulin-like domain-containing nogo receptor-interacting protein 1 isoform X2 n=1 Tax=Haliotis rufescens TaxID=6454 RepID=UPI00201EA97F|nr:leucine-rich repeat and immunoglobulin-like domain-containing nogo receptor-interacting protein 1 isoform X2 [Haliotis rufescens]XP_048258649.1 leucine-rich repeat and immunoglobulin-like domain-containing nogo receptor-interacting protein 1 isoform X2 [Haliotis rufescens]XP_048258650.1 leucine-rich repeat and immunoglobulin-like domain-containing nogo receptor-interacting protein 1 isoform X2 [Haliotis rufescens]XP_048258651.1 leucine-rich repeat and immunoglobulin-like domain-containing nog
MRLLIIYAACFVCSVSPRELFCPPECLCHTGIITTGVKGYIISSNSENMSRIPDLSGLTSNPQPKLLRLSRKAITRVTPADFPEGIGITRLILAGNREMNLEDDAFSNLHDSLEYLDLEITKIFFNNSLTFLRGLGKLKHLDLSFNNKYRYQFGDSKIVSRLFYGLGMSSLKKLKMYNCGIQSIGSDVFLGIETLEELDLAGNSLSSVPDGIAPLSDLSLLDLSHSRFATLKKKRFMHNKKLMTLKMLYTRVTTIDADALFGLEKSLENLHIAYSKLSEFPTDAIKHLTALKVFELTSNPLTTIPGGSMSGSFCLKDLHISQTSITLTHNSFEGQEKCIKHLFMRNMGIENIPVEPLRSLKKLHHLFLDENKIQVLRTDSLTGIKANLLVLSENPLARIEKGAFNNLTYPLYVELPNTRLEDLNFALDYSPGTFDSLNVRGLSLECDCTLAFLIDEGVALSGSCNAMDIKMDLRSASLPEYLSDKCSAEANFVCGHVILLNMIGLLMVSSVRNDIC